MEDLRRILDNVKLSTLDDVYVFINDIITANVSIDIYAILEHSLHCIEYFYTYVNKEVRSPSKILLAYSTFTFRWYSKTDKNSYIDVTFNENSIQYKIDNISDIKFSFNELDQLIKDIMVWLEI